MDKMDWNRLRAEWANGTFDPMAWTWAVGVNAVLVPDEDHPDGRSYKPRVCIYIMGQGAEQCFANFTLIGEATPDRCEEAKELIQVSFGVTRILDGVG